MRTRATVALLVAALAAIAVPAAGQQQPGLARGDDRRAQIQPDDIAVLELPFRRNPVDHLLVHRRTQRLGIPAVPLERRGRALRPDRLFGDAVQLIRRHAGPHRLLEQDQCLRHNSRRLRHDCDLVRRLENDHTALYGASTPNRDSNTASTDPAASNSDSSRLVP